jgi:hypothetical protein
MNSAQPHEQMISFGYAQRLYVASSLRHIRQLQAAAVPASELPAALTRAGLRAVNGKAWDVESVAAVIGLDEAIRAADLQREA